MAADAVVTTLKSMKLHGMADAVAELAEQGSPAFTNGNIQVNDKPISIDGTQKGKMDLSKMFEVINSPVGRCACV